MLCHTWFKKFNFFPGWVILREKKRRNIQWCKLVSILTFFFLTIRAGVVYGWHTYAILVLGRLR